VRCRTGPARGLPSGRAFSHADAGHHDEQTRRSQNRHQSVTARGRDGATGPAATRARYQRLFVPLAALSSPGPRPNDG